MRNLILFMLFLPSCCNKTSQVEDWFTKLVPKSVLIGKINLKNWNSITKFPEGKGFDEIYLLKDKLIPKNKNLINPRKEFIQLLHDSLSKDSKLRGIIIKEQISEGVKVSTKYILYLIGNTSCAVTYYRFSIDGWIEEKKANIPNKKLYRSLNETISGEGLKENNKYEQTYCLSIFTLNTEYSKIHCDENFGWWGEAKAEL